MKISKPRKPKYVRKHARRAFNNRVREELATIHGEVFGTRQWSFKGAITRIFGQGIQRVFKDLPATNKAAITGSMGVAVYDMILHKRDLNWIPNDVDVFIAIPPSQQRYPLHVMLPIVTKWLNSVRSQGFQYELKDGGACFSSNMCIFDYVCTNARSFPKLRLPKISFIGRPARSVRAITREFDLCICGPILSRSSRAQPIKPKVTYEMEQLFKKRIFYSDVNPFLCTRWSLRTWKRVLKYIEREFDFLKTEYIPPPIPNGYFPSFPFMYYRPRRPLDKQFVINNLGREPTTQECSDFNIVTDP